MTAANPSSKSEKLSVGTKLAFGTGDLGAAIVATVQGFFLNAFLLDVAGMRPAAAGAIFLIVKIWDSINDPIIGAMTDRTNTRWGRRRPWLLFGAVPFGLAFFLHWLVPDVGATGKFIYYLVVALLLDTAFTAVNVPYTALTPELSTDYDERTSLNCLSLQLFHPRRHGCRLPARHHRRHVRQPPGWECCCRRDLGLFHYRLGAGGFCLHQREPISREG